MPQYDWECLKEDCKHVTLITRPSSEYRVPPEKCEKCGHTEMRKIIVPIRKEQVSLVHGGKVGWHDEEYTSTRSIK